MIDILDRSSTADAAEEIDRPDWIPGHIVADWNPSPYAYQTKEELMSQGALHASLITYINQVMPYHLHKFNLLLWIDLFLLYRDKDGVKKRIGPDLMLANADLELPEDSWDLEKMQVPEFIGEITSSKSRKQDLDMKRKLYHRLGVSRYLVVDGYNERQNISGEIVVRAWHNGREQKPDRKGFLDLPELHVKVKSLDEKLVFYQRDTLEPLMDLTKAEELNMEKQRKLVESAKALSEKEQALSEKEREIEGLKEKLRRLEG